MPPRGRKSPKETVQGPQQPDVVVQESADPDELTLARQDQQAAVASPMGGSDQYPYVDRTAIPLHERNMPNMGNSPLTEASQADLNPAFTPKPEDGGPVNDEGAGVGTEPNAADLQLAAAQNEGGEGLRAQVQEQLDAAQDQQLDAEAVTAAAQERAPEGVDASTGQASDSPATPPGAPSGMEPTPDGEGTQGATA